MSKGSLAACWIAVLAASGGLAAAQPPPPPAPTESFAGTWDLTWRKRQGGESRSGHLVIRQTGRRLTAEVHGQGSLRAAGEAEGPVFSLRGRRMGVPFTIGGRLQEGRLVGSVKVLTVDRRFVGVRRSP